MLTFENYRKVLILRLAIACAVIWPALAMAQSSASVSVLEDRAETHYNAALELIASENYGKALSGLRRLQVTYPGFSRMASVQTRIAVLSEASDAGDSLAVFMRALDLRDDGKVEEAISALGWIAAEDPRSVLADDALYVKAYLQVMDRYDFNAARIALQQLRTQYPDTAYQDSADYLDAIAMEQQGDTRNAKEALIRLRDKHTALSLPLNFRWPAGSVLSRYWFDRTDRRIAIVERRLQAASSMTSSEAADDGRLRLGVNVDGIEMQLLLSPSPLTRRTDWHDGRLSDRLPPALGIYHGEVEGVPNSWVRAVLQQNSITGVVQLNGRRHRLLPAHLIGTLDYYQPRSRKNQMPTATGSALADNLAGLDALTAPPETTQNLQRRARAIQTDVRAVPVSIVVDSQFDRYYAGAGLSTALNNLNIADGIYRQFGIALTLDEAVTFDETADPMQVGPQTLESILRSFRDYRLEFNTLFESSALTYLFTGNPKTDVTLGLAWIDTACRLDGYDVGVTTPSSFGDVLLTHELGHSLGSLHDTDTGCNADSLSLMWPNISSRTQTSFTSCSKDSILKSRTKSCLQNTVDLVLSADAVGNELHFHVANPDGALTLDARLVIETGNPDQLNWPAGCQAQTPTSATCHIDKLAAMETRTLAFAVSTASEYGDAPVTAQVQPINTMELSPGNNTATASLSNMQLAQHQPSGAQAIDGLANSSGSGAGDSGGGALHWLWCLLAAGFVSLRRTQRLTQR